MPTSTQALFDTSKCVYCGVAKGQQLDVWIALLAAKAGVAANAPALVTAVQCIDCNIPEGLRLSIVVNLLCKINGGACDLQTVSGLASPLENLIPSGFALPIAIVQTAGWAGLPYDSASLNKLATCLECGLYGLEWSVIIYLLALIAGVSTAPASLISTATGLQSLNESVSWAAIIFLLSNLNGGSTPPVVAPIPDGLWWKFNEGSGPTAGDSTANHNAGNIGAIFIQVPTWSSAGPNGTECLTFDGQDGYVLAQTTNGLTTWTNQTVTAWFNFNTGFGPQVQFGRIMEKGANSEYALITNLSGSDTQVSLQLGNGSNLTITSPLNYGDSKWHFAAGTINLSSGACVLYIDGVMVANGVQVGVITKTGKPIFGMDGGMSSQGFNGDITDVRIYEEVLTAAQILAIYTAGAA